MDAIHGVVVVTAPDMVSVIAAALLAHSPRSAMESRIGPTVTSYCACGAEIGEEPPLEWPAQNHAAHQARAVLAAITEASPANIRIIDTDSELQAAPVRIIVQAADGTVAARYDAERGVLFGDNRPFPWSVLRAPAVVLREAQ